MASKSSVLCSASQFNTSVIRKSHFFNSALSISQMMFVFATFLNLDSEKYIHRASI